MLRVSVRRNVFLLLLLAVVGHPMEAAASPLNLLDHLWTFVKSAWSASGPSLDPNGAPAPQGDEGPQIDPDGAHVPQTDEGPQLDPNG